MNKVQAQQVNYMNAMMKQAQAGVPGAPTRLF